MSGVFGDESAAKAQEVAMRDATRELAMRASAWGSVVPYDVSQNPHVEAEFYRIANQVRGANAGAPDPYIPVPLKKTALPAGFEPLYPARAQLPGALRGFDALSSAFREYSSKVTSVQELDAFKAVMERIPVVQFAELGPELVQIGRGRYGKVTVRAYRGKPYAVKEALPGTTEDSYLENAEDLLHEAYVMRTCAHRNVVPCVGFSQGYGDGSIYMLMPLASRGTLESVINRETGTDERPAVSEPGTDEYPSVRFMLDAIINAARGLAHMHSKGFCHGDIHGANILVSENLVGAINDMGFSFRPAREKFKGSFATMDPQFNPPETYGGHVYTFTSDVWNLAELARVEFGLLWQRISLLHRSRQVLDTEHKIAICGDVIGLAQVVQDPGVKYLDRMRMDTFAERLDRIRSMHYGKRCPATDPAWV